MKPYKLLALININCIKGLSFRLIIYINFSMIKSLISIPFLFN